MIMQVDTMSIETKLNAWHKKTISKAEPESLLHPGSDFDLYNFVFKAVSAGPLSPIKNSGTNRNKAYPIYLKYRITVQEDYSKALMDIAFFSSIIASKLPKSLPVNPRGLTIKLSATAALSISFPFKGSFCIFIFYIIFYLL